MTNIRTQGFVVSNVKLPTTKLWSHWSILPRGEAT